MTTKTIKPINPETEQIIDLYLKIRAKEWQTCDVEDDALILKEYPNDFDGMLIHKFEAIGWEFNNVCSDIMYNCEKQLKERGFSEDEISNLVHKR